MARATIEFDSGEDLSKAIDLAESSSYARDIKIISERPFTVEGSASVLATFKGAFRGKGIRAMNSNQSFSNGRQRAEAYLNSRMAAVGVKVENAKIVHVEKNRGGFSVYIDGKEADFASNQAELHAILRDYDSMGYRFDKNKSKM